MDEYKVSVITPVFNSEDFVGETFESIKNQTFNFEDIEVIFINDKSTDSSREIIAGFCDEYDNVKLFDSPEGKKGPGPARNIGLNNASADYVIFLDSDDRMTPEYVETVYNEITQNDVDMVKTSFFLDLEGNVFPMTLDLGRVEVSHDDLSPVMEFNFFEPWATIYRKSYLDEENICFLEDFNIHESFLFAVESIAKAKKGIILLDNFQGQIWKLRPDGLHNQSLKEKDFEYTMHCLSEVLLILREQNQPLNCIKKISRFILAIWCFDLFTADEPKDIVNAFTFAKGFRGTAENLSKTFDW